MKSSDLITVVIVIALFAGGWYLIAQRRNQTVDAGYWESRPSYFDTEPTAMASDWTGWDAKVDVFLHHHTNRPGCDAIEYGWLAWHDHIPVVKHNVEGSSKRVLVRTDRLEDPNEFLRVPPIELPFDRGVNIEVSTRLQRNQYLVNWAHHYGFRFTTNTPNEWRDYYRELKSNPGQVIIVPAAGHTMKECRTAEENTRCQNSPSSMRCDDDRYHQTLPFLYPEWTRDVDPGSVLYFLKEKKQAAAAAAATTSANSDSD